MSNSKLVSIYCVNNQQTLQVPVGSTLREIYPLFNLTNLGEICCANVNYVTDDLDYTVFTNKDVEYLDLTSEAGLRTYARSLFFLFNKAFKDLHPTWTLNNEANISGGCFCTIAQQKKLSQTEIEQILCRMREIVTADIPFIKHVVHTEEAIQLFKKHKYFGKVKLLQSTQNLYTTYYTLENEPDYYYGPLLRSTNQLQTFYLVPYHGGILLQLPNPINPSELMPFKEQPKMIETILKSRRFQALLGVSTVGDLNVKNEQKESCAEIINISEALQEKEIAMIAETIKSRGDVRLALIAGPSSSGKTTFSKRLSIQLFAAGIKTITISMDDYFVDQVNTPRDETGDYDFESVYALNIDRLQKDLKALFAGEEVELPRYDFPTGKSVASGNRIKLDANSIIVMEGIHGLNPILTESIPDKQKFKIFVSAISTIKLDYHNFIPTSDNRLLRRIIRDAKYRNYDAQKTIVRWPKVLEGEAKWITPFREEADAMFNSALLFELAGIRAQALPLLERVPESAPEYTEASRLRRFLSYFLPLHTDKLPYTSLLREFLGGSAFHY